MTANTPQDHAQNVPANPKDSYADALVALVITAVFVGTCIFWIAGQ